jgi:hypothetical protein
MRAVEEVGPCADSHAAPTVAAHTAAIAPRPPDITTSF